MAGFVWVLLPLGAVAQVIGWLFMPKVSKMIRVLLLLIFAGKTSDMKRNN